MNMGDSGLLREDAGSASDARHRLSTGIVQHLNILPTDSGRPSCSQRFEHRFFGGKPSG
jgi:hypothetical protein